MVEANYIIGNCSGNIFNLSIPKTLEGVDTEVLNPRNTWTDKDAYDTQARELASMYIENFKKYLTDDSDFDFTSAGPQI